MMTERREQLRRAEDQSLLRARIYGRIALGALALWAVIATVAVISLIAQTNTDQRALHQSHDALVQADSALVSGRMAIGQAQAAAAKATAAAASAVTANQLATAAATLSGQIQQSRLEACREGNLVHHKTIALIRQLVSHQLARAPRARRIQIRQGENQTFLLIDVLAPLRNCPVVVAPKQ